jgi:hypothetical protein
MKTINNPKRKVWLKRLLVMPFAFVLALVASRAHAQLPPPPPAPPPPGEVLNSINPFKSSKKKKSAKKKSSSKSSSKSGLPAPPDPLHLTKKVPAPPGPPKPPVQ